MAEKQLSKDEIAAYRKSVCHGCNDRTFKRGMLYCNISHDIIYSINSCRAGKWRH